MILRLNYRSRIFVSYIALILISIVLSLIIYFQLNNYLMYNEVCDLALKSVQSDVRGYELILRDINNTSKILMGNKIILDAFRANGAGYGYDVNPYLSGLISFNDNISSVYLFRNDGLKFFADNDMYKGFTYGDILAAPWYDELLGKKGGYLIKLNVGGLPAAGKVQCISFFRLLKHLDTQKPVGIICINTNMDDFMDTGASKIQTLEKDGNTYIITNNEDGLVSDSYICDAFQKKDSFSDVIVSAKDSIVIVGQKSNFANLYITKIIPFHELPIQASFFPFIIISFLLLNGIFILVGSLWTSKYILKPVNTLIVSMKGVYKGEFRPVKVETANDEIGEMKNVYNIMIERIQQLIYKIKDEQSALRKAELDIVSAQIKPHFLYNTLDSINSLARMGDIKKVTQTIKALADFYRISLNNGVEMISFQKELSVVQSYLSIQELRYQGVFTAEYDIAPDALPVNVPKMILQPLVENSLYHGIRGHDIKGLIRINARTDNQNIYIEVIDNGIGMDEKTLQDVLREESIGLGATMKRIRILYGAKSSFEIRSGANQGVFIGIRLRKHL